MDFLRFSPALTYCEKLVWDSLGCFTAQPRMFGGQIPAPGHGQQKGIWWWDIACSTLSAKRSLRPWWAAADRCHFSHPAGCEMRGIPVCSHYHLLRELRRSAGRISVHSGCVTERAVLLHSAIVCCLLAYMSRETPACQDGHGTPISTVHFSINCLGEMGLFLVPIEHNI